MGARIQARLHAEAERLRQADRRLQRNRATACPDDAGLHGAALNGSTGSSAIRTRDQRMADALDRILNHSAPHTAPDGTVARDVVAGGGSSSDSGSATAAKNRRSAGGAGASGAAAIPDGAISEPATPDAAAGGAAASSGASCDSGPAAHKRPSAQVILRAELADLLGEHGGMGEIAGTGPVPAGVIDRLCCNADISVVLFGKRLTPLYEIIAARAPTAAQRRALIAREGACIGCGAAPDECAVHHILSWRRGGPTQIDNLVLVCWYCHDRSHDHNWQVVTRNGRYRLVPPDATSPPNPAPSKKPTQRPKPQPTQDAALFP
ncbi:MAG: HNH endonuclease signature motif containing protein [Acidimicrobiaceae bacterium]|nr:HNH endonuclease signature motif containing protein [Acidimicrobiaceae bacterium]